MRSAVLIPCQSKNLGIRPFEGLPSVFQNRAVGIETLENEALKFLRF